MANIKDELPRLMRMNRITSEVGVDLKDGKLICTLPKDSKDIIKVREMLGNMIRETDLTGSGDKVGGVAVSDGPEHVSYTVNVADMHKSFQEMCGVSVNGHARTKQATSPS